LRKKDFVFEVRDLWPELPREMGVITNPVVLSAMSFLEWLSYRSAKGCIGLSPGIVEGIKKRSSKNKPITMVPNGCDLDLFSKDKIEQQFTSMTSTPIDSIGIPDISPENFVAIFTGAHGKANGLHAVLDSAELLKTENHHNIKLVFIGDGKEKPSLVERKEELQLDNCIFLDPVQKEQLPYYMLQADAALMVLSNIPAFYYGTSPNKFFDYLAMGMPIVNNYPGWLAGLITDNNIGIAVEPDSPRNLADALIQLSKKPEELEEMGLRARGLGEQLFDRRSLSIKFVQFLEQVHQA